MPTYKQPLTKSEKRLLLGTSLFVGTILVGGAALNYLNSEPDWNFPKPHATPVPNGHDIYLQAVNTFTVTNPPVDPVLEQLTPKLTPAQAAQRYSLVRRRQWLTANQAGFSLLRQARKLPCVKPRIQLGLAEQPGNDKFRVLARYQTVEANTYRLSGDYNRAFKASLEIAETAYDTARGGHLLDRMLSDALLYGACQQMEAALAGLTESEAINHSNRLFQLMESAPPLRENTIVAKWERLNSLEVFMRRTNWRGRFDFENRLPIETALPRQFLTKRSRYENIVQWWNYAIAMADQPYGSKAIGPPSQELDGLLINFSPTRIGQNEIICSRLARVRMVYIRLRLHAYCKRNEIYPASLDDLQDPQLSKLTDPFTNPAVSFHYRRKGNGYQLWSVGPDGVNNQGKSILPVRRGFPSVFPESKGDIVVPLPPEPTTPPTTNPGTPPP